MGYPRHIARGAGDAVYMTDGATREYATTLRKIDPAGVLSTIALPLDPADPRAADGSALPVRLTALAADAAGNVYVATEVIRPDSATCACLSRSTVRKLAPDGKVSLLLTSDSAPDPMTVYALAVDKGGNVFALGAQQLVKVNTAGNVSVVMRNGEAYLNDIAVDAVGNLYFTAWTFSGRYSSWPPGAIGKVTPQGVVSVASNPLTDPRFDLGAALDSPVGIAVDAAGVVFVSTGDAVRKLVLP